MTMRLTSTAFAGGAEIPSRYTCDGDNLSPPLAWSGAPPATRSFTILFGDPDRPGGVGIIGLSLTYLALSTSLQSTTRLAAPACAKPSTSGREAIVGHAHRGVLAGIITILRCTRWTWSISLRRRARVAAKLRAPPRFTRSPRLS